MKQYISHKIVKAARIVSAQQEEDGRWSFMRENDKDGCAVIPDTCTVEEAPRFRITEDDLGYVVHYADGYVSWSPTKAFEEGYSQVSDRVETLTAAQLTTNLDFGMALDLIKDGARMAREGWNGKGMFVFLVPGSEFKVNREPLMSILGEGTDVSYRPHIDLCDVSGTVGVWQPSMGDVMADDWYIVREAA